MKHALLSTALAIPVALALASPADEVTFAPSEGLRLTKTFTIELTSTLDDTEVIVNGKETEAPGSENDTELITSITVTDRYTDVEGGRARRIERTFDGISSEANTAVSNPMMGDREFEITAESDLDGRTVVFEWNEEDEVYEARFAEGEDDEELLAGLVEDMDLRRFVPADAVSDGDTWEVPPNALASLLAPGGDLRLVPDEGMGGVDISPQFELAKFLEDVEGNVTATYRGTRTVGDRRMGVIELSIATESNADVTDFMREAAAAASEEMQMGVEQDIESADSSSEYELQGELLWDLEGGHLFSLEIEGDTESILDIAATVRAMGEEIEVEQSLYLSGEVRVRVEVTRE